MGFLDFLTKGEKNPDVESTTSTTHNIPSYLQDYWKRNADMARQVSSQPYQRYGGQRVAGLTDTQRQGIDYTRSNATAWQDPMNQALQTTQRGAEGFSAQGMNQFMNPFQDQVVDRVGQLGWRDFDENVSTRLRDEFTGSGQFGSSRHMDAFQNAARDQSDSILGQQGQLMMGGYNNAMDQYGQWQDRALGAGSQLGALAQTRAGLDAGTSEGLLGVGGLEQAQRQAELDVPYQDFVEERDWGARNLGISSQAMAGYNLPFDSSSTSKQPGGYQASPLAQIAGVGLIGGALFSDRRLKTNVVKVGTHPTFGIGVYEYDIFGEREIGYMADEVYEVMPEAIKQDPATGYFMVDYDMVEAA